MVPVGDGVLDVVGRCVHKHPAVVPGTGLHSAMGRETLVLYLGGIIGTVYPFPFLNQDKKKNVYKKCLTYKYGR